jgi:hypothetical protein
MFTIQKVKIKLWKETPIKSRGLTHSIHSNIWARVKSNGNGTYTIYANDGNGNSYYSKSARLYKPLHMFYDAD